MVLLISIKISIFFSLILKIQSRVEHLANLAKAEPVRRSKVKVNTKLCGISADITLN